MEKVTPQRKKQQSFEVKKEAVELYENGNHSEEFICEKYGIILKTFQNWREQVSRGNIDFRKRAKFTDSVRRKAVREILSGVITVEEAKIKYGVKHKSSIQEWIKAFSSEISNIRPLPMSNKENAPQTSSDEQKRIKELEEALLQAQLKIAGLETLIDVAEKELHIDIRKKPGTKQS